MLDQSAVVDDMVSDDQSEDDFRRVLEHIATG
jgi:hypothetical protein